MAEHTSHKKEYFLVFLALAVLTVVELYIPELDIEYFYKASSLTLLALAKAALVYWSFMHLKSETKWMKFIALTPAFALMYAVFVIVESVVR